MHIFVLGTGRSGTHWVGWLLDSHPDIRATIEQRPMFPMATMAAVRPRLQPVLLPALRAVYAREERRSRPRHYADKSHPVLWYADRVADWFPQARFVATVRSPYGTIASMLRSDQVSRWQRQWRRYGVPNPFLGIDESNADTYEQLSPAERAALRWRSHRQQTERLRGVLGDRLLVLNYEEMIDRFDEATATLWRFLDLPPHHAEAVTPKAGSRDAWRERLTDEDIAGIERITGISPDG